MFLQDLISRSSTLQALFKDINDNMLNHEVKGISANSKAIQKDFIFVAIKGNKFDGSTFIEEAFLNGAFLVVAEELNDKQIISTTKGTSRLIYSKLIASFYEKQPRQIIGVTGTNGKTSTVEFCRQLWVQAGWKAASMGTLGTKIETSRRKSVYKTSKENLTTFETSELHKELDFLVKKQISHLALEASSHGIDQHRLDGVKFSGAVFTNLSHDHIDYHKNISNYFLSKKRLFTDILKKNSAIAINVDDDFGKKLFTEIKKTSHLTITFGKSRYADVKINSITQNNRTIDLILEFKTNIFYSTIGMVGDFQVYNVVAAASICIALGMDPNLVFKSLCYLKPAKGRMEIISGTMNNSLVIIDYAHSPAALKSVLKSIKVMANGKIITLFGCGGERDTDKRKVMGEIAAKYSDLVIITDDNPRNETASNIREEILKGCPNATEVPNRNKAISYAVSKLEKNDLLLIAGKGHETSQTIGTETLPFDDFTVAKEALKNIKIFRVGN